MVHQVSLLQTFKPQTVSTFTNLQDKPLIRL